MTSDCFLAENQLLADGYLKAPASRWDQRKCLDAIWIRPQQFLRQTDGEWRVVSQYAIFDTYGVSVHECSPVVVLAGDESRPGNGEPATWVGRLLYAVE